jgi:hypothetical protein
MQRRILLRLGSLAAALSALGLLIFHVTLFWRRMLDASITQPAVLARWIASALLIAALLSVRKRTRHLLLLALMLAALLHIGIPREHMQLGVSDDLASLVQVGLTAACGVLLSIAATASVASASIPVRPVISEVFVVRRRPAAIWRDRSPPTF